METPDETLSYTVAGMSCDHCRVAISNEISALPGVVGVDVDLDRGHVSVRGHRLDDVAIRAAIGDAGYEVQ